MNATILGAMFFLQMCRNDILHSYITAAPGAWLNDVSSAESQNLPVSITFTAVVESSVCSVLIDCIWPSEFPNVVKCLQLAASLPSSRWELHKFEQHGLFMTLTEKSDALLVTAAQDAAAKKETGHGLAASMLERFDSRHIVVDSYNRLFCPGDASCGD